MPVSFLQINHCKLFNHRDVSVQSSSTLFPQVIMFSLAIYADHDVISMTSIDQKDSLEID